jgi:hypothetical protein
MQIYVMCLAFTLPAFAQQASDSLIGIQYEQWFYGPQ